jgi:ornithine cyclodeaminase/alanine dehydrogenase-like protein (mu-crystallin family)
MALYLSERDVISLLTMQEAIAALEQSFLAQARGEVINQPRRRLHLPRGTYHTMGAADLSLQTFGQKAYVSFLPKARFLFLLYDANNGDLLSMMEADRLGQVRTGAATGLASRYLAIRDEPLRLGLYGAGWQARTQLEAVCAVCNIAEIAVYSRDRTRLHAFCDEMALQLGRPVLAVDKPEIVAQDRQIVITATSAKDPVLLGEWLSPGAHVSAVGSNMLMKREIDDTVVSRSDVIVLDSIEQARIEAGDLLPVIERRLFRWEKAIELHQIVSGASPGRTSGSQITLFKSLGVALEDVAVATLVYHKALANNAGIRIPLWS